MPKIKIKKNGENENAEGKKNLGVLKNNILIVNCLHSF